MTCEPFLENPFDDRRPTNECGNQQAKNIGLHRHFRYAERPIVL
jgi:hypothetical protein